MKTSYFANFKKLDKEDYVGVSIALYTPDNIMVRILDFAPSKNLLMRYKQGLVNEEQYTKEYTEQLDELFDDGSMVNHISFLKRLEKSEQKEVVLLCYEGKGKFCHRHILADFLKEKFDLDIREI